MCAVDSAASWVRGEGLTSWGGEGPDDDRLLARAERGDSPAAEAVLKGAVGWKDALGGAKKVELVAASSPGSDPSSSPPLLSYGSSTASAAACRLLDAGALGLWRRFLQKGTTNTYERQRPSLYMLKQTTHQMR